MARKNCWEVQLCGRQPGGHRVRELGICPAATLRAAHGINQGCNGGRACWALTGTMSGPASKVQGIFARTLCTCFSCKFYEQVLEEEGEQFQGTVEIVEILRRRIEEAAYGPPLAHKKT